MPEGYSANLPLRVRHQNEFVQGCEISTWKQFAREVRSGGCALLRRLDEFPDSVLVTGCQRSGTTILTRIIAQSAGMVDFRVGRDDELDGALILSDRMRHVPSGRYCFQTTYVNECYREYFEHGDDYRIIWVLRNPASVVWSLLHHWSRFALDELFAACGVQFLSEAQKRRYRVWGGLAVPRIQRACLAYNGKTRQLFDIVDRIGEQRIMIVDYDELVMEKSRILPEIYRFIDLPYDPAYAGKISARSIVKFQRLSTREQRLIHELCEPVYRRACSLKAEMRSGQAQVPPLSQTRETA